MNGRASPAGQIAWAAGLFEGEGCITMNGSTFHVRLNNTNQGVVAPWLSAERLQKAFELTEVRFPVFFRDSAARA